jgi:hypothetical protein
MRVFQLFFLIKPADKNFLGSASNYSSQLNVPKKLVPPGAPLANAGNYND